MDGQWARRTITRTEFSEGFYHKGCLNSPFSYGHININKKFIPLYIFILFFFILLILFEYISTKGSRGTGIKRSDDKILSRHCPQRHETFTPSEKLFVYVWQTIEKYDDLTQCKIYLSLTKRLEGFDKFYQFSFAKLFIEILSRILLLKVEWKNVEKIKMKLMK